LRSFLRCKSACELELIQSHMSQKPVLRGEVGCACVAREVSVERGSMGEGAKRGEVCSPVTCEVLNGARR